MERYRGPSLALPAANINKTEGGPRQRRRLQKSGAKHRSLPQTKSPVLAEEQPQPVARSNRLETAAKLVPPQYVGVLEQPPLPLPPDLSDSKWLEYIRKSGFLCATDSSFQSKESLPPLVPEFSHLALTGINSNDNTRPSFESGSTTETQTSSDSKSSAMRRQRAKTPVFSIGQLESAPLTRDALAANKASSVELIAEQYTALIEHRDMDDVFTDSHSEPAPSRQGYRDDDEPALRRQLSSDDLPSDAFLHGQGKQESAALSPTSDDGTLVSFEEETVYFKPISFSPEPQSPTHIYSPGFSPATSPYNLSLQICLELLTRELSAAVSGRRHKTPSETAALQIWVMIEAYERLRDQVAEMRISAGEASGVETIFDTWLMALYSIHDSLTTEARREIDETEIEGLEEALD